MMRGWLVGGAAMAALAGLAIPTETATAGGKAGNRVPRSTATQAFAKLKQNVTTVAARGGPSARFDPVQDPVVGPVTGGIKVWGELVDPSTNQGTGQFVNMAKQPWKRNDRFYLWFETSSPVYVSLFQVYPGAQKAAGDRQRQVMPDSKFPESLKAIPAGTRTRFPVMFKMDDTNDPESMAILVQQTNATMTDATKNGDAVVDAPVMNNPGAGAPPATGGGVQTGGDDTAVGGGDQAVFRANRNRQILARFQSNPQSRERARFNAVSTPDPTSPVVSTNPEDVCVIALTQFATGFLEITLIKVPS